MATATGVGVVAGTTLSSGQDLNTARPPAAVGHMVADASGSAQLALAVGPVPGSAAITIEAVPEHALAVSQIYFYFDSTFEGTDLVAPYCLGGTTLGACTPFETADLANGVHTIKAFMSYNQGSLSAEVSVTMAGGSLQSSSAPTPVPTSSSSTTLPTTPTSTPPSTTPPSTTPPTSAPPITTTSPTGPPTTTTGPGSSGDPTAPFVGLNVYELASDPGVNLGCGTSFNGRWSSFFASLPRGTVVRFWATQQMATSAANPGQLDWTALDAVFEAAAQYHVHLIAVLANEWTDCDGTRATQKQLSWFQSGYQSNTDQGGLSYTDWLRAIVTRYADSAATYLWEPIDEAQANNPDGSCSEPAAASALRSFFDSVGGIVHAIDPVHQVESGLLGEGNCGTANADYATVGASPGIDVLSYHDYYPATEAEGGDPWNGIGVRIAQAAALHKPILVGEDGIVAGSGCSTSVDQRRTDFEARIQAQGSAGVIGMLLWNWQPAPANCTYDLGPGDPSLQLLRGMP